MERKQLDDLAVENFRKYLRIRSVHPSPDYESCVKYLESQADDIGLEFITVELVAGKPIVVLKWEGAEPQLPAIMLNSHMDVVPVREDLWKHDPFAAELDDEGRIYARGSQDTKQLAVMHMEAVRRLKMAGVRLRRTILITIVPDEEIGGGDGMEKFCLSEEFRKLNVGFEIDESMASPGEEFIAFYGERSLWRPRVHCWGVSGHGSTMMPVTAGEKLRRLLDHFMDYRQEQLDKLQADPSQWVASATSINLTMIQGGVQVNVVPPEITVRFDMRLSVTEDFEELEQRMREWCADAGEDVELVFDTKEPKQEVTDIGPTSKWWTAVKAGIDKLGLKVRPVICPGTTDARFVRQVGIPAIGFSAMNNTPILLHGNDEFITVNCLLQGICIFEEVIRELGNV